MAYKEIGELFLDENMKTGIIKTRDKALGKKTTLFPDSERLLYNYCADPHVRDMAYFNNGVDERIIFVGRNVFIDYNGNTGNFYCENPRYALRDLMNPVAEGGLGVTHEDLYAICENLQYAFCIDNLIYVVSQVKNGNTVLFTYDVTTREVKNTIYENYSTIISPSILYCKPVVHNKEFYFFIYRNDDIEVYVYSTATEIFQKHNALTEGLVGFAQNTALTPHTIEALLDRVNDRILIVACVDGNVLKVYNLLTGIYETIQPRTLKLTGKHIKSIGINDGYYSEAVPSEYLVFLTDDNTFTAFSSTYSDSLLVTQLSIVGSQGVTGFFRFKEAGSNAKYVILYRKEDNDMNFVTVDPATFNGITQYIPAANKPEPLMDIFSRNIAAAGWFNHEEASLNIGYGSYNEAGVRRILIKQFSSITLKDGEHVYVNQGNLEASSGIISVEGAAYGNTQYSRLHLRAEQVDSEEDLENPDAKVYLHEYENDETTFTTGSYLWKQLYKIGLPFNTHVETAGRIIIDGYDIPISKTLITRNSIGEEYGDVLFTFDKHFNPSTFLTEALQENINQYPGILFFKNRGFLNDAIIVSSYEREGSPIYNDDPQGDLFSTGIHTITASALFDDRILLVASSYGCLASINIRTFGYTNIKSESKGDEPPPYYRSYQSTQTPDNIKAIIPYKNKIWVLTNSGCLFKIAKGTNTWEEVAIPDTNLTSNPIHYLNNRNCKAHAVQNNLLLISWPFGAISSFDMDSEIYTEVANASQWPSTPCSLGGNISGSIITEDSITVGSRIYFIGDKASGQGKTLCWFDILTKAFGYAKNPPQIIADRIRDKVDLAHYGPYVYMIIPGDLKATLIQYDSEADEYTILGQTIHPITRCGLFYWNKRLYSLFGIDGESNLYIQVYSLDTGLWSSHLITNSSLPILYDAKGIIHESVNEKAGSYSTKIKLFWGVSADNSAPGTVSNTRLIEIDLANAPRMENSVSLGANLDTVFNNIRLIGYNLEYDKDRGILFIVNGLVSGTSSLSNTVYRYNPTTDTLISSVDEVKPAGTWKTAIGLFNHNVYSVGGYTSSSFATAENIHVFNVRDGTWSPVQSLAYNPGKTVMNGVVPVITAMKVIHPWNMLVLSYMDGGVGSMNTNTGEIILPTDTRPITLSCIHAPPGLYADRGAYDIHEDDEDVIFIGVDCEFKFAKNVGVFFKKMPRDSSDLTFAIGSTLPYPVGGCSQVAIGKYVLYFNGYDEDEVNWKSTIHRNVVVLDTSEGEYAVLATDTLIRYKYNAFSYYFNGYVYTFGGICKEDQWNGSENVTRYNRRAVIERYDLVTGHVIELSEKYGVELNETENRNVGQNQVVQLTPSTYFGLQKDPVVLASLITANDNLSASDNIKQWYFFDLITEKVYSNVLLGAEGPVSSSVVLLRERKSTHELYSFEFNANNLGSHDATEYANLIISKNTYNGQTIESTILKEAIIKSPVKYQGFVSGLADIIYDRETDCFVIPSLQKTTPQVQDKSLLAITTGYIYNPELNDIDECTRDGTNPTKLFENSCSIPMDKSHLSFNRQCTVANLMPVYNIAGKYSLVNPHAETMTSYTKEELFGTTLSLVNDMPYSEWTEEQKALYALFTFKESESEVASNVTPDKDPCFMQWESQILRAVIVDEALLDNATVRDALETLELFPLPSSGESLYLILSFDKHLKIFKVLYHELIEDLPSHPYTVSSAILEGIVWSFITYHDESVGYSPIISYKVDTGDVGRHVHRLKNGLQYMVHTEADRPHCIVNSAKNIVYLVLVNREDTSVGFTGVVYTFFNLNHHAHISNVAIQNNITEWDTEIPSGTSYYTNLSINANGYIFKDTLFIDIFNGQNKELSYSQIFKLLGDGSIDEASKVTTQHGDFMRSDYLKDSTYLHTYDGGVLQDIAGYREVEYKGKTKIVPIIALDSSDVLKGSLYPESRTFISFNGVDEEIPALSISLPYSNTEAHVVIQSDNGLFALEKKTDDNVYLVEKPILTEDKYTNFCKSGFLPSPFDTASNKIVKTKTIPISNGEEALVAMITNSDDGIFLYHFNVKNRFYKALNGFNYISENTKSNKDGDVIVVNDVLYMIGTCGENDDYLTMIRYSLINRQILDIRDITYQINGVKCVYNSREKVIYILGGIDNDTGVPNTTIYTYNIEEDGVAAYISSPHFFASEVVDAYYNCDLNKTFIQLKTDAPSQGKLLSLDHSSRTLESLTTQDNPIITERMIETKLGALAYINKDMSLETRAHRVFDPVTLNYIDEAGNSIQGIELEDKVPSEVIPLKEESLITGVSTVDPGTEIVYQSNFASLMDGLEAA